MIKKYYFTTKTSWVVKAMIFICLVLSTSQASNDSHYWLHETNADENFFDQPIEEQNFDDAINDILPGNKK